MLGHSHALSGAVTGTTVGVFALHATLAGTADLAVLTAGFATVCDLDQCGSSAARSFGLITEAFAHVVRKVSGGHRHATHTALGAVIFAALAWLAGEYRSGWWGRVGLFMILALGVAAGLEALCPPRRGPRLRIRYADLLAAWAAAAVCVTGWDLALVPYAAALGILTHIAGDELTKHGCPFFWPATDKEFHLLPRCLRFTTGTWPERRVVVPLLALALIWLSYRAVSGHIDVTAARHLAAHLPRDQGKHS
jgi:membrane-bound metal-dependent hydrolase YbcI (DUF457 family)